MDGWAPAEAEAAVTAGMVTVVVVAAALAITDTVGSERGIPEEWETELYMWMVPAGTNPPGWSEEDWA